MRARPILTAVIAAALLATAASGPRAQAPAANQVTAEYILQKFKPTQRGVEYDTPTAPDEVAACVVEKVLDGNRKVGDALRDGRGQILRRFVDTDGNNRMDRWSYYLDGFEVYRDLDLNDDRKVDEAHWLNAGGTRVAKVVESKIVDWKRLSAEEASRVLVQALVAKDFALLETVLATPAELLALGAPKGLVDQATAGAAERPAQLAALGQKLTGWDAGTTWLRFDGVMPHLIPADAAPGLKGDLVLYENAVIYVGGPNGEDAPIAYLQVPELVRVGEAWKFVDLPRAFNPARPEPIAAADGLRSWLFREGPAAGVADDPVLDRLKQGLADYDAKNADKAVADDKAVVVRYHYDRIPLLVRIVERAKGDEPLQFSRAIVDSLAAAYQTGKYEPGLAKLNDVIEQGGKLASYAAFRKINAKYALKAEVQANILAAQQEWLAELESFVKDFPDADEAPDALLQLGSAYEFNGENPKAREYYTQLVAKHAETESGRKGAGALNRLDLVGKVLELKGEAPGGGAVDVANYRGKTVLVFFWSDSEAVQREVSDLVKLYDKQKAKGFEIVGVCLESDKAAAENFIRATGMSWPQIDEPKGLDGRLANENGILSLPTMYLVDPEGKVVDTGLRLAAEVERALDKPVAQAPGTEMR